MFNQSYRKVNKCKVSDIVESKLNINNITEWV